MTVTWLPNGWRLIVDGDAAGGWICEVHDGDRAETYTIKADTREAAMEEALKAHNVVEAAEPAKAWPFTPPAG